MDVTDFYLHDEFKKLKQALSENLISPEEAVIQLLKLLETPQKRSQSRQQQQQQQKRQFTLEELSRLTAGAAPENSIPFGPEQTNSPTASLVTLSTSSSEQNRKLFQALQKSILWSLNYLIIAKISQVILDLHPRDKTQYIQVIVLGVLTFFFNMVESTGSRMLLIGTLVILYVALIKSEQVGNKKVD